MSRSKKPSIVVRTDARLLGHLAEGRQGDPLVGLGRAGDALPETREDAAGGATDEQELGLGQGRRVDIGTRGVAAIGGQPVDPAFDEVGADGTHVGPPTVGRRLTRLGLELGPPSLTDGSRCIACSVGASTTITGSGLMERRPPAGALEPFESIDGQHEDRRAAQLDLDRVGHEELARLHDRRHGIDDLRA